MSKTKNVLLGLTSAVPFIGALLPKAFAQTPDYLIEATDTIPIFQTGAAAVKSNGVAVLNIAVPYLAGAAVAFAVILILWVVVKWFKSYRA